MQKGNLDTSKEELQFNDSDFEDDEVAIVEGGAECLDAPDDAMDPDPNDPRRTTFRVCCNCKCSLLFISLSFTVVM